MIPTIRKRLEEGMDALNEELRRTEDLFRSHLGTESKGRVQLQPLTRAGRFEHLIYRDGKLLVEVGYKGKPSTLCPLIRASKGIRILGAGKLRELWENCGGPKVAKPG